MDIYDETSIKNWQENDYPLRVEDQPILVYNKKMYTKEDFIINGMILDTLDDIVRNLEINDLKKKKISFFFLLFYLLIHTYIYIFKGS